MRAPTPRCARRSSTTAATRSPRRRRTWSRAASRSAPRPDCGARRRSDGAVTDASDGADAAITGVCGLPGGPELLELVAEREDVELIGGATRDLLLARTPKELDVVVDGGAEALARALAEA